MKKTILAVLSALVLFPATSFAHDWRRVPAPRYPVRYFAHHGHPHARHICDCRYDRRQHRWFHDCREHRGRHGHRWVPRGERHGGFWDRSRDRD